MLDKRFPEYWANQARLDIIWQFYWIEKVFQPPDEVRDFNYHKKEAKDFRKYMRDNMKTETCGVCARRTRWNEFHYEDEHGEITDFGYIPLTNLKGIHLLKVLMEGDATDANLVKTAECPRDALTTYQACDGITYCLSDLGMVIPEEGVNQPVMVKVCKECLASLDRTKPKIPPNSLVRFDAGSAAKIDLYKKEYGIVDYLAKSIGIKHSLKPLSMYEQNLVSLYRGQRHIYIMKSKNQNGQYRMRGHVIAIQNIDLQELADCFPLAFDQIPNFMQAVFISVSTDKQDIASLVKTCPAFKIDAHNLVLWIKYLLYAYKDLLAGTRVDLDLIERYGNLDTVPQEFVDCALIAQNEEQARTMAVGFMGGQTGRQGYANTADFPTADEIASSGVRIQETAPDSDQGDCLPLPPSLHLTLTLQIQTGPCAV